MFAQMHNLIDVSVCFTNWCKWLHWCIGQCLYINVSIEVYTDSSLFMLHSLYSQCTHVCSRLSSCCWCVVPIRSIATFPTTRRCRWRPLVATSTLSSCYWITEPRSTLGREASWAYRRWCWPLWTATRTPSNCCLTWEVTSTHRYILMTRRWCASLVFFLFIDALQMHTLLLYINLFNL